MSNTDALRVREPETSRQIFALTIRALCFKLLYDNYSQKSEVKLRPKNFSSSVQKFTLLRQTQAKWKYDCRRLLSEQV